MPGFLILLVLLVLLPATASAQTGAVPTSEHEWTQLWHRVNENPYYLRGLGRDAGAAIVAAAVQTRPDGHVWAALAGTICNVDGPTRLALTDSARVAEFGAARACLERIEAALPDTATSESADYVRSSLTLSLAEVLLEAGALARADSIAAVELERGTDRGGADVGNIVYRMNQVRGRVALRHGRHDEAIRFLHQAGETPGSPQLNSFGPQLYLARELLAAGEVQVVRAFLGGLRRFWIGPDAEAFIVDAMAAIDDGRVPDGPRWR